MCAARWLLGGLVFSEMQYGGPAEVVEGTSNDWNLNKDLLDLCAFVLQCVCMPGSEASLIRDHNRGWVAAPANFIYWFPGRSIGVAAAVSHRIRFTLQFRGKSLKIFNISSHLISELSNLGTARFSHRQFPPRCASSETYVQETCLYIASAITASAEGKNKQ